MVEQVQPQANMRRGRLLFGVLGSGIAWTGHLLLSYVISEFGCIAGWDRVSFMGVTLVAWLLLGGSVIMLSIVAAATWVSYSLKSMLKLSSESSERIDAALWVAHLGLILGVLFMFIIAVESVPILFFLSEC